MIRLSDRNMSRGDVLLPQGVNNGSCNRGCKDCLLYAKWFLMQLSVALGLHFGWGLQLNTSEMFWIDISRWMISSRCRWISVYLSWRTAHAFEPLPFFIAQLAFVCAHNPVNCPAVICLPRMAILSSFGRETSLVNIIGPRSIFPILFTPTIIIIPCVLSFVNNKAGGIDNSFVLVGKQSYLMCAGPGEVSNLGCKRRH